MDGWLIFSITLSVISNLIITFCTTHPSLSNHNYILPTSGKFEGLLAIYFQ